MDFLPCKIVVISEVVAFASFVCETWSLDSAILEFLDTSLGLVWLKGVGDSLCPAGCEVVALDCGFAWVILDLFWIFM